MDKYLEIIEIRERTRQGRTKPFMCTAQDGQDGQDYFVKGTSLSLGERIKELMGACLGTAFGLPIPDYTIVQASPELLKLHGEEAINDLGNQPAFASRSVVSSHELRYEHVAQIDVKLQRNILMFDTWIRNDDRNLTERGGNPNLLWSSGKLYVIDHNLIFDNEFDNTLNTHVFHKQLPEILDDSLLRQEYEKKMQDALKICSQAWYRRTLPEEWQEENEELALFDADIIYQQLNDDAQGAIWKRLRP